MVNIPEAGFSSGQSGLWQPGILRNSGWIRDHLGTVLPQGARFFLPDYKEWEMSLKFMSSLQILNIISFTK